MSHSLSYLVNLSLFYCFMLPLIVLWLLHHVFLSLVNDICPKNGQFVVWFLIFAVFKFFQYITILMTDALALRDQAIKHILDFWLIARGFNDCDAVFCQSLIKFLIFCPFFSKSYDIFFCPSWNILLLMTGRIFF